MFRFRLEKVLRWRHRQADVEARKLQALLSRLQRLRERRQGILDESRVLAATAARTAGGRLDLQRARLVSGFLESRLALLDELTGRETEILARVAAQQQVWRLCKQKQDVLERLRDRHRDRWRQQQRRNEQKQTDETANRHVGRVQ